MRKFKGEREHFSFNKCAIYTDDGASAKFSTNSHETDNSVFDSKFVQLSNPLCWYFHKLETVNGNLGWDP